MCYPARLTYKVRAKHVESIAEPQALREAVSAAHFFITCFFCILV